MTSQNPESGIASGSRGGMKLYAWIVSASTILLLGLILWPLSVHSFRATASFHLGYDPSSGLEKASLNRLVIEAFRNQTSSKSLASLIGALNAPVASPLLKSRDPDRLRHAINIYGRPGTAANSVDYQVMLTGQGSPDEIEFLNNLIVRLNTSLDSQLNENNTAEIVDQLTSEFQKYHTGVVQHAAAQIQDVLHQVNTAGNDLQIIANDLSLIPGSSGSAGRRPFGAASRQPELSRLLAEKERLLQQPGMTPFHAEVTSLQQRIEKLQAASGSPRGTAEGFLPPSHSPGEVVHNRFTESGSGQGDSGDGPMFASSLEQIVVEIGGIDWQTPRQELANLEQLLGENRITTETVASRLAQKARSQIRLSSPISITDFQKATSSVPVDGVPGGRNFLWLCLFAAGLASVLAINTGPDLKSRKFRSPEQLQSRLGIPVLGMVQSARGARRLPAARAQVAMTLVKLCEWTLLGIAIALVVVALLNSQVAAAFLENPFHGITRTVWMFTTHS